ncbi:hypothetical protein EYF80_013083 [Liparis tanakae]|uniref:Uncharacterized protein n=1 Tax=Liparis tanakae TaxID=230148 RepID=A0A4Z2IFS8_9TELE|nr:hypothetical protein EYF80_013083 [Liparis tanakae]
MPRGRVPAPRPDGSHGLYLPPPPPSTLPPALCQSPDTSFCHLCRPAPSCQQFKSAWRRLPPVAADNTAVQMLPVPKRWRRQRGLTSALPVGTTEQHFGRKLVAVIPSTVGP